VQIRRKGGHILLYDRAGPYWMLGLFLVAGGVVAMAPPAGLAKNAADLSAWERFASFAIGLGVSAGALWWLWRSPRTRVEIDLTYRRMRVGRLGISGRQVQEVSFEALASVELEETEDSEGGLVNRPLVRLNNGESILLSQLWSHDRQALADAASAVAQACGLPAPQKR
jgi:uncharacterized membrane protein